VFDTAVVAPDVRESMFKQTALQILFELLADESGQVTAVVLDLLLEAE
jgi:hypothetical protein